VLIPKDFALKMEEPEFEIDSHYRSTIAGLPLDE
jgi:hypothetical protein